MFRLFRQGNTAKLIIAITTSQFSTGVKFTASNITATFFKLNGTNNNLEIDTDIGVDGVVTLTANKLGKTGWHTALIDFSAITAKQYIVVFEATIDSVNAISQEFLDVSSELARLALCALEANVELHVSNAINNTIPLYVRAEGTITADNTEQTIYEANPTVIITPDSITLDLGEMVDGDIVIIRMYSKVKSDGDYELVDTETFLDSKTIPAINITGGPNRYGWKATIEQTEGVLKDFDWESYTLTT